MKGTKFPEIERNKRIIYFLLEDNFEAKKKNLLFSGFYRSKRKKNSEKIRQIIRPCQWTKKAMEHQVGYK